MRIAGSMNFDRAVDRMHDVAAVLEFRNASHRAQVFLSLPRAVVIGMLVCIGGAVIAGILLPWSMSQPIGIGAPDIPFPLPFMAGVPADLEGAHE